MLLVQAPAATNVPSSVRRRVSLDTVVAVWLVTLVVGCAHRREVQFAAPSVPQAVDTQNATDSGRSPRPAGGEKPRAAEHKLLPAKEKSSAIPVGKGSEKKQEPSDRVLTDTDPLAPPPPLKPPTLGGAGG